MPGTLGALFAPVFAALAAGDYAAYEFLPGNPLGVPGKERDFVFSLSPKGIAARAHPFLFTTAAELEAARTRTDAAAARWRADLERRAEDALAAPIEPPDERWYESERGKPFGDIYPVVYRHTTVEPVRAWRRGLALARAAALTGRGEFRRAAAAMLRAWTSYQFAVEHYDAGLNYAIWALMALESYDLLHADLAAEDHERVARFFERCLRALMRNDCFWIERGIGGGINNHLAWHRYAAGAIALFYGVDDVVRFTVAGPRSIVELAERGLRDGGLWLEGSIPYQATAQEPLVAAVRLYRRHGVPIPPLANGRSFRDFFRGFYEVALPDLTLPPIGDAYGSRPYLPDAVSWDIAYELWRDPLAAGMLAARRAVDPWRSLLAPPPPETPPLPVLGTRLFPEHGYAILREPAAAPPSAEGWMLLATYDRAGVHSNADKLSFMLFGRGNLWLEDREGVATSVHSFSADIQRELNRHTICHNALLVDWACQRWNGDLLDLVAFRSGDGFSQVSIADREGRLYPGVKQLRSFVLTPLYAVDVLTVRADREATLILPLHIGGEERGPAFEGAPAALPAGAPWSYLKRPRSARARDQVHLRFGAGGSTLSVLSRSSPAASVWRCEFPCDDRAERFATLYLRTLAGRAAQFVHLFWFEDRAGELGVAWEAHDDDGLLSVSVSRADGATDRYVLPALR